MVCVMRKCSRTFVEDASDSGCDPKVQVVIEGRVLRVEHVQEPKEKRHW